MYERLSVQGLSEKGIDNLRADLAKTDAECEEEIRRAVYDNYQHFIGVTQVMPLPSEALSILCLMHPLLAKDMGMLFHHEKSASHVTRKIPGSLDLLVRFWPQSFLMEGC